MLNEKAEFLRSVRSVRRHVQERLEQGEATAFFYQPPLRTGVSAAGPEQTGEHQTQTPELATLAKRVANCRKCGLSQTRGQVVFGEGSAQARLVLVGEAPGAEEDRQGRPFVGAAGKLLTRMLEAISLQREQVYICNILKCRPPGNRNPLPEEIAACEPHLREQLELLKPDLICTLGTFASQTLLNTHETIGRLRGRTHDYQGIPVIPTFHPAALLYHPGNKQYAWEDMQRIAGLLKLKIHAKKG